MLFISISLEASQTQIQKFETQVVSCSNKNNIITFSDIKNNYTLYDKNSASVKIQKCEKIKIDNLIFYSLYFSSEIQEGLEFQKALSFEIAYYDQENKKLITVRSETIDQLENKGDPVNAQFENSIKPTWSYSQSKKTILLKVEIMNKTEKIEPYFLLFNKKKLWFENIFFEQKAEKTNK